MDATCGDQLCGEDELIRRIDALTAVHTVLLATSAEDAGANSAILSVHRKIREMPVAARLAVPVVQPLASAGLTENDLPNLCDMLQGNINRMMVTKDDKELRKMYEFAERRLQAIYRLRDYELMCREEATPAAGGKVDE